MSEVHKKPRCVAPQHSSTDKQRLLKLQELRERGACGEGSPRAEEQLSRSKSGYVGHLYHFPCLNCWFSAREKYRWIQARSLYIGEVYHSQVISAVN